MKVGRKLRLNIPTGQRFEFRRLSQGFISENRMKMSFFKDFKPHDVLNHIYIQSLLPSCRKKLEAAAGRIQLYYLIIEKKRRNEMKIIYTPA